MMYPHAFTVSFCVSVSQSICLCVPLSLCFFPHLCCSSVLTRREDICLRSDCPYGTLGILQPSGKLGEF